MDKTLRKVEVPAHERRSYQRTSFRLLIIGVIVTLVMDFFGVTANQVTEYAGVVITKTFSNLTTFALFLGPLVIKISEMVSDYQKIKSETMIKLAEIQKAPAQRIKLEKTGVHNG